MRNPHRHAPLRPTALERIADGAPVLPIPRAAFDDLAARSSSAACTQAPIPRDGASKQPFSTSSRLSSSTARLPMQPTHRCGHREQCNDAFAEPGLALAAICGEMGQLQRRGITLDAPRTASLTMVSSLLTRSTRVASPASAAASLRRTMIGSTGQPIDFSSSTAALMQSLRVSCCGSVARRDVAMVSRLSAALADCAPGREPERTRDDLRAIPRDLGGIECGAHALRPLSRPRDVVVHRG